MVAFSSGSDGSVTECDAPARDSDASGPESDDSELESDARARDSDDSEPESDDPTPERAVAVAERDGGVVLSIGDVERELTRAEAAALRRAVGDAIAGRRVLYRTVGEYRPDGSYVVARRGAESSGNEKVFESFAAVRRLYDRLPPEFGAEDVGGADVTGSRRHMLVRHFGEHPAFDCAVVCRNPLRVAKAGDGAAGDDGSRPGDATGTEAATEDGDPTTNGRPTDATPPEVGGG